MEVNLGNEAIWWETDASLEEQRQKAIQQLAAALQPPDRKSHCLEAMTSWEESTEEYVTPEQKEIHTKEQEKPVTVFGKVKKFVRRKIFSSKKKLQKESQRKRSEEQPQSAGASHRSSAEVNTLMDPDLVDALHKAESDSDVSTNTGIIQLWDFGGKPKFYPSHHKFLNSNSAVNIIVMDISKGLKDQVGDTGAQEGKAAREDQLKIGFPSTQEDFLCYWLRSIEAKATHKQENTIMVLTHKDKIPQEHSERYVHEYISQVLQIIKRNKLPDLAQERIHIVDNTAENETEFDSIKKKLLILAAQQRNSYESPTEAESTDVSTWGGPKPVWWLSLEADMYKIQMQSQLSDKHMTLTAMKELVQTYYNKTDADLESFLLFHHEMGNILFFPEEGATDTVITNPQWLINITNVLFAPYALLGDTPLTEKLHQGCLDQKSMEGLWQSQDSQFILDLTQKLDLTFPIGPVGNQQHIIPSMLPCHPLVVEGSEKSTQQKLIYRAKHMAMQNQQINIGTFSMLVTKCAAVWPFKTDKNLSYCSTAFEVGEGITLTLTLPHASIIDVAIWCDPSHMKQNPGDFCADIAAMLSQKLKACQIPHSTKCRVLCPLWTPTEADHMKLSTAFFEESTEITKRHFRFEPRICSCHEKGSTTTNLLVCMWFPFFAFYSPNEKELTVLLCFRVCILQLQILCVRCVGRSTVRVNMNGRVCCASTPFACHVLVSSCGTTFSCVPNVVSSTQAPSVQMEIFILRPSAAVALVAASLQVRSSGVDPGSRVGTTTWVQPPESLTMGVRYGGGGTETQPVNHLFAQGHNPGKSHFSDLGAQSLRIHWSTQDNCCCSQSVLSVSKQQYCYEVPEVYLFCRTEHATHNWSWRHVTR